jgi:hypothetical protein
MWTANILNRQVSWSDSYAACKKFGMVSIGIGKPEKQKCVSDAAKCIGIEN